MSTETGTPPTPVSEGPGHGQIHPIGGEYPGEHGIHPVEKQYMIVALVLAVLTAIEVGISYAKRLGDASAPLLIALAATKFFLVASYFMHLKFDNRILRRIFLAGMVLAGVVYGTVFLTLGIFSHTRGVHG
jgi:cytochrome c oxidase subunit IV